MAFKKPDFNSAFINGVARAQEAGAVEPPADFYENVDLDSIYKTKIDLPKGPLDVMTNPDPPWGKPEGWDYRTAETGWKGEELPNGAEGWKPDGTPHFGGKNAFQDWWNGWQHNITKPAERSSESSFAMAKEAIGNKNIPWWQRAIGGVTSFFEGLGNVGLEEGEAPTTGITKASRWTGQLLLGAGLGLGRLAEVTEEQVGSRIQALEDIGDEGGVFKGGESLVDREAQFERVEERLTKWTNPVLANNATQAMKFLSELTDVLVPVQIGWNALRAVVSPLSLQEKRDIMAERVESGKILYTTFIEPAKKQQYLDRVRQGEDPYLVSVELQNPWAEMGGQAILDPLNILGGIAKGSGLAKSIGNYQDYISKPLAGFGEFFAEGANKLLKFDDGQDITMMAERLINARQTAKGMLGSMATELNVEGGGMLGKLRPVVNKALERSGVFSWSASGKRHHLQRVTKDMMEIITKVGGKNPDEALEIVENLVRLQGDDIMDVAEALGELGGTKIPLNYMTSEAGMRFGAVMREMLLDADGVISGDRFIQKFKSFTDLDDIEGLSNWLNGKIDNVAKEMFPDLSKRREILTKVAEGEELTTAEKLIGTNPLTAGEKFWVKAEDIAQNKFLTGVNRFFANVYMGLSPGYAMRNLFTNELHVLTDLGPVRYIESWAKFNPAKATDELVYMTRDTVGQMANIGVGQGGAGKLFGQKLAGTFEKWGGQRLFGMAYKDTLDKMIPVVVEEVSHRLKLGGATDEQIALYKSVVNMTYGRFDEASEVLRQGMKTGAVRTFETGNWLPEDMLKFFDQYQLGDDIRRIIRAGGESSDDVAGKIQNLFRDVRKHMKKTERMFSYPDRLEDMGLDGFEHYDDVINSMDEFTMANDTAQASVHAGSANRIADQYYKDAIQDAYQIARRQGKDVDFLELAGGDPEIAQTLQSILDGTFYQGKHEVWRESFKFPSINWVKWVENGEKTVEQAWKALDFLDNDHIPKNISVDQFRELIWNVIMPAETRKMYAPLRDTHAVGSMMIKDALEKAGVQLSETNLSLWEQAGEKLAHAQAFDTHVIRNISWDDLGRATGDTINNLSLTAQNFDELTDIKYLGIVNGISTGVPDPTQANRMIPTRKLLDKINEGLAMAGKETYENLDEIPFQRADLGLSTLLGEKFQPIHRMMPGTQVDIPPAFLDVLDEAKITKAVTKTAEMDQRVSELVKYQASLFKQELGSGAGKPGALWIDEDKFAIGSEAYELQQKGRWGWTTPEWYKKSEVGGSSAYYKGQKGRKAVESALDDIISGADGDEALMIKLRQAILDRSDRGTPEDFLYELRNSYHAYTPPPSEIDDLMGMVDDMPEGLVELRDQFGRLTGEWGFDVEDEFWQQSPLISAPEMLSEPHAYLAVAPQLRDHEQQLMRLVKQEFGKMQETFDNDALIGLLDEVDQFTGQQETVIRTTANEFGTHARNFGLVNYESRRNIDTLTGTVMPYQFWYGRTYSNWATRVARDPSIVANYYRYKQAMAESHAGMPEFWQENINSAELLGLWKEHPLFYNLEATLNPLQGLTGTDFEDKRKRVDGWSMFVDDLNRFGPTTHPLFNYALAFAYMLQGKSEASSRWGGRLIPQTSTFNALGSVLGSEAMTKEIDPAVWLFSGGIDPYMRRRVGRAFPQMISEGALTDEQAIDSVWSQEGEFWEMARQRAVGERAWGQLSSFFLGVGFKGRNQGDIQTDMMYDDFYTLMNRRVSMKPDDFKQAMGYLQQKYPFMDSVLISAKTGEARDMAFSYSVLSRIQPGDSNRLFELTGVDDRLVQKFYDSRGDFEGWAMSDKNRFMAGIIDLNAILAIPDDYTAQMWTNARARYSQVTQAMEANFGKEINDEINHFYALKNAGQDDQAEAFLQANQQVEQAMQWKLSMIVNDETGYLEPYYVSINKIESYWFGKMYGEAKKKFGQNIFDVQGQYFELESSGQKKSFLSQHPELKEYWDFRDQAGQEANSQIVSMASKLPQELPQPLREDLNIQQTGIGIGAQDLQQGLQQPQDPLLQVTPDQWEDALGKDFGAVYRYVDSGESFTYQEKKRIRETAEELGIDLDRLVQYVGISLTQNDNLGLPNQ